ncbi:nickel transporter permease [Parageobacillus thermoglucosidasius]|uniref:nickel transporter permease n=1 Tax=Parageobacillus thermoglucosidasius TaxID=1426 RepID=UPI0001D18C0A|nr:nickel transporter permease [Parageobacillus thermoglucosidasius]AEH48314.1 ABC-type transporter, integral membrane subunit [Parageobacillus thermoglucosidasius C56-YS93]
MKIIKQNNVMRSRTVPFLLLFAYLLAIVTAPLFAPYDPFEIDLNGRLLKPSAEHLFGTDHLGRDLLSRILAGGQVTVGTGLLVLIIVLLIGVPLGMASGFIGGRFDRYLMRIIDAFLAFPDFIIAIILNGILGPGMWNLIVAIVVAKWGSYARLVRSTVLSEKEKDYILMAVVNGLSTFQIIRKHLLPHVMGNALVLATLDLGKIILLIASLSYIGLGAQPPTPEWGAMLNESTPYFHSSPHLMVIPGIAIMSTVLVSNLVGDALRDRLDVKE